MVHAEVPPAASIRERWSSYRAGVPIAEGAAFGPWVARFNGYGSVRIVRDRTFGTALELAPETATHAGETHAGLVTTLAPAGDFSATLDVVTVRQLRVRPNGWEAAWVLWHYADNEHFYYFILNASGWELGKKDGTVAADRRFVVTGGSPSLAVGRANRVQISQRGPAIAVSVDGKPVISVSDDDSPYASGRLGLYCEDAVVRFGAIALDELFE